jgi:hypothetical protein
MYICVIYMFRCFIHPRIITTNRRSRKGRKKWAAFVFYTLPLLMISGVYKESNRIYYVHVDLFSFLVFLSLSRIFSYFNLFFFVNDKCDYYLNLFMHIDKIVICPLESDQVKWLDWSVLISFHWFKAFDNGKIYL